MERGILDKCVDHFLNNELKNKWTNELTDSNSF